MLVETTVECPVYESFRTAQINDMFSVPRSTTISAHFKAEVPGMDEDWKIGVITGSSGDGKSTIARKAFGDALYTNTDWPDDKAVIDCFGDSGIHEIVDTLTSVGFSSPPHWIKPYRVLSEGEKFRCNLARGLLAPGDLLVFDEFGSLVDATVARICSNAVSRAIRKSGKRMIAVGCRRDIIDFLEPNWVLDMASKQLARGSLWRAPDIQLEIRRCERSWWNRFKAFHYLDSNIHNAVECYLGIWEGQPVAFCATLHAFGFKDRTRISRIVVAPDYQGVGIGGRFIDAMAQLVKQGGRRVTITASHPSILGHCKKPGCGWVLRDVQKIGFGKHGKAPEHVKRPAIVSAGRGVATFEYIGIAPAELKTLEASR